MSWYDWLSLVAFLCGSLAIIHYAMRGTAR
jgi:hypothetical protein